MSTRHVALIALILSLTFIDHAANAASFNCTKATTQTEKLICADPELGRLDEQLAGVYGEGKHIPGLKNEQRAWLAELKKCNDVSCLKVAYRERLEELTSQIISFGRSGGMPEQDSSSKNRKADQEQKAGEELANIGQCLAVNSIHQNQSGSLSNANQAFMKKHTKLAESYVDGYSKIRPCIQQGSALEQCADQLPPAQRHLVLGFSNGTFMYNKAKRDNDTAMIKVMMVSCGAY